MAERDIIMMRRKDLKILHVIRKVIDKTLLQREAADILQLSERQIRRMVKRIKNEGDTGIIHRSRGRESNRKLPVILKEKILDLYKTRYCGFGPTLFAEKLLEQDHIAISDETARLWLIQNGDWVLHRTRKAHRQWRQRKARYGEMVQMDGSHHDWFEGRGPACVFMGYIDDATGRVFGKFYLYEGTIPAMDSFKRYIRKYGIPMSIYLDKHTTYKSTAKLSMEDELKGKEPLSEFGRALDELGCEIIHANSPQAKGRVERLFNTLQDRLVKEMRLKGIHTIEAANKFLVTYLPIYNRKFAVKPREKEDLHVKPGNADLDSILCIKTERTVRRDRVIRHNNKFYQITHKIYADKVIVEDHIDGSLRIRHKKIHVPFHEIDALPQKQMNHVPVKKKKRYKPPADHPWRRTLPKLKGKVSYKE